MKRLRASIFTLLILTTATSAVAECERAWLVWRSVTQGTSYQISSAHPDHKNCMKELDRLAESESFVRDSFVSRAGPNLTIFSRISDMEMKRYSCLPDKLDPQSLSKEK